MTSVAYVNASSGAHTICDASRAHWKAGQFPDGAVLAFLALLSSELERDDSARARALNELGRNLLSIGSRSKTARNLAHQVLRDAATLAERDSSLLPVAASAAEQLARLHLQRGFNQTAASGLRHALDIGGVLPEYCDSPGDLCGISYARLRARDPNAGALVEEAEAWLSGVGSSAPPNQLGHFHSCRAIHRLMRDRHDWSEDFDEAIRHYTAASTGDHGEESRFYFGLVLYSLASARFLTRHARHHSPKKEAVELLTYCSAARILLCDEAPSIYCIGDSDLPGKLETLIPHAFGLSPTEVKAHLWAVRAEELVQLVQGRLDHFKSHARSATRRATGHIAGLAMELANLQSFNSSSPVRQALHRYWAVGNFVVGDCITHHASSAILRPRLWWKAARAALWLSRAPAT